MKKKVMIMLSVILAAGMILGLSACTVKFTPDGRSQQSYNLNLGYLDLEEISDALEKIGLDELAQAVSDIDLEEISGKIEEAGRAVTDFINNLMTTAVMIAMSDGESSGDSFGDSFGDSTGGPSENPADISFDTDYQDGFGSDEISVFIPESAPDAASSPDLDGLISGSESISEAITGESETDDSAIDYSVMEIVKDILGSLGMEDYYSKLIDTAINNPELMEKYADNFADSSSGMSGSSEAAQDSAQEAAPEAAPDAETEEAAGGLHAYQG